jgi:bifunctional N-acetylglucosamine-1-phosphate-uridyltransferase/glucosamine-1-phosphate-acetyltransferase GlmU-like protein
MGSRLRSLAPKVLTPVAGSLMIDHIFRLYANTVRGFVLVVHPSTEDDVRRHCEERHPQLDVAFAVQHAPTGMLDAILLGTEAAQDAGADRIWITWCDQIGVHRNTIARLDRLSGERPQAAMILPTSQGEHPYVHIDRDPQGRIAGIRQRREGDAMPAIGESDMGLFSLSPEAYFSSLPRFAGDVPDAERTGERNFLPFIPWLVGQGQLVLTFPCTNSMEALGINTPEDKERMEQYLMAQDPS